MRALLVLPSTPSILLIPFAPLSVLTRSVLYYYLVGGATMLVTLVLVLGRAVIRRRRGARAMVAGGLLIVAAGINDMLFSSFLLDTGNLIPLSLAAFVCIQDVVLARRFTAAFDEGEALSAELAVSNRQLGIEIDRYMESQRSLESLLSEKDLLLKEVHHRVKNSLQIVSSVIALQARRAKDPMVLEAYGSMTNRIRAISLAHEKLYSLSTEERIDLGGYTCELVKQLASSYGSADEETGLAVQVEPIDVPMGFCIDFGLLLTELVANAFVHSLLPRRGGSILVELRRDGEAVLLRVEDDGPGFPAGFSPEKSASLGFRIATTLVRKHDATLNVPIGPRPAVEIRFPMVAKSEGVWTSTTSR